MNANQAIDEILNHTNIKINYSQLADILSIKRQNIVRYKTADLSEKHVRAIENHFRFSLAPKPVDNSLQIDDKIMRIKVPKGTKVLIEYEE